MWTWKTYFLAAPGLAWGTGGSQPVAPLISPVCKPRLCWLEAMLLQVLLWRRPTGPKKTPKKSFLGSLTSNYFLEPKWYFFWLPSNPSNHVYKQWNHPAQHILCTGAVFWKKNKQKKRNVADRAFFWKACVKSVKSALQRMPPGIVRSDIKTYFC